VGTQIEMDESVGPSGPPRFEKRGAFKPVSLVSRIDALEMVVEYLLGINLDNPELTSEERSRALSCVEVLIQGTRGKNYAPQK